MTCILLFCPYYDEWPFYLSKVNDHAFLITLCSQLESLISLQPSFKRKLEMIEQFVLFMERTFQNGHAEDVQILKPKEEQWYLPCFGVYPVHSLSLMQVRLTGPDQRPWLLLLTTYQRSAALGCAGTLTKTVSLTVSRMRESHSLNEEFSTVKSLYDPLGFVCPVTIQGKLL